MVCPVGSTRMAVMVRLLAGGSYSQTTEEVGHRKLAAHFVSREVTGADEANLLDEEDMHMFGLEPMVDPLQLVCCNACKKPIKASQYAAHAELCRLVISANETHLEHGGRGHKKSPRKGRKNMRAARSNRTTTGSQERFKPIDVGDSHASQHLPNGHPGINASSSMDTKIGALARVDVTSKVEASEVSPENMDNSACLHMTAKRSKLRCDECLPSFNDAEKSILNAHMYVPAPLATKVYYSQRRNRLRLELNYLYEMSIKEVGNGLVHPQSPPSMQKSNEITKQSLDICSGESGRSQSAKNFSTQVLTDSVHNSQTAHVGVSSYITEPYPFAGSSGELLGSKHQKNGTVPVT